jgi:tRNA A-37 threonylcarbamoyl transferase component Bud32
MELFWTDPNYTAWLTAHGLRQFDDFLNCSQARVIRYRQNGSRSVAVVSLGTITAYLKREFRIAYKEKLRNWWDGFGAVGKALREWRVLRRARRAGFITPQPIACGQRGRQAFLMTAELVDFVPLDKYLAGVSDEEAKRLSYRLAEWLARWHAAGFMHPDLYAWHIFVRVTDQQLAVLDLARAGWLSDVPWPERWRELALLGASLRTGEINPWDWEEFVDTYLNAVEEWEPNNTVEPRGIIKDVVSRRMEAWAGWVSRRRGEEEQCRWVLTQGLYPSEGS